MADWYRRLRSRNQLLADVGTIHLALSVLFLLLILTDSQQILGINRWIKPFKFASSITIFVWTVGWIQGYLTGAAGTRRFIARGIAVAMLTEMGLIALQALRGTTSHFNVTSGPFNAVVFSIMGVMILFNTIMAGVLAVLFFRHRATMGSGLLWGIRFGLLIFLAASAEGFVMVRHLAHTVGAPDGGPGLPLVNWSTVAGDLRIAHFVGLHALQALPLAGWAIDHVGEANSDRTRIGVIGATSIVYLAIFFWLLMQALAGTPLLRV